MKPQLAASGVRLVRVRQRSSPVRKTADPGARNALARPGRCHGRGSGRPTRARPADALLRLVPPDAAVVLTVEGLRDRIRAFTSSRLATDLRQLPAVKAWFDSEKYRQFEKSRAQIEALLGAN